MTISQYHNTMRNKPPSYLNREHHLRHVSDLVGDAVDVCPVLDDQRTHGAAAHLQRGGAVVVGVVPESSTSVVTRDGVLVWEAIRERGGTRRSRQS